MGVNLDLAPDGPVQRVVILAAAADEPDVGTGLLDHEQVVAERTKLHAKLLYYGSGQPNQRILVVQPLVVGDVVDVVLFARLYVVQAAEAAVEERHCAHLAHLLPGEQEYAG